MFSKDQTGDSLMVQALDCLVGEAMLSKLFDVLISAETCVRVCLCMCVCICAWICHRGARIWHFLMGQTWQSWALGLQCVVIVHHSYLNCSYDFPADGTTFNFLFCAVMWHHSINCCLDSGSKQGIQISSSVTICTWKPLPLVCFRATRQAMYV
jgi:hypothetical protein